MKYTIRQTATWDIYLLIARAWLGYSMITGGQSVLRFFSSQDLRNFFQNWFGNELGIPAPLVVAFIAKGTEFAGGILVSLGLFTRISAALVAIVMLSATLIANINWHDDNESGWLRQDGVVTISCFLFGCLFVQCGAGRVSLDRLIRGKSPADLAKS